MSSLHAISPIDGRYFSKVSELSKYFSEAALIKYRVRVEIEYYISLCKIPLKQLETVKESHHSMLRKIYIDFSDEDALRVKEIEKITNHDVKAVEYFIKEKLENSELKKQLEFIHFGLTSQDINNTAIPLSLRDAVEEVYLPELNEVISELNAFSMEWKDIPMLARTHGQPASPTRLGKEIMVYAERLKEQYNALIDTPFSAKFGGATGNFNAHFVAYPEIDWVDFSNEFVNDTLGLYRTQTTTQVEHYDNLARLFDAMKRINTILIDLNRDLWTYISMDYFKQKIKAGEIGSSAMPHKVNPIDFENSEGNLGIANALFEHLAAKLPVSRLQRDLTDSTVLRNIGVPIAHTLLSIKSMLKGFSKLLINKDKIAADLNDNWAVVAEAIQTVLRRENYDKPYEALKELTRKNEKITQQSIAEFIDGLAVSDRVKQELKAISPFNYTGIELF
ncbi:MAG: adenylosuccinate lyase [Bacteroidetes bacterium]|nr:MAG: adenylosuccinate lyase [Bacteroidota bacterium]MBL1145577.1 adenylosuccinate lyase [Bacteroidota bacterium]NOG58373.1 adenylosuccinate lyase [Bacteroidota bacterium]